MEILGAVNTGLYPNFLEKVGMDSEAVDRRIEEIFQTTFYGSDEERLYHPVDPDMGFITDTGNNDVRTEGMSYGMMLTVQLDKKEEFDRIWKWTYTNMYMSEGTHKGFFCWSNSLDGSKNANGPAPDGEEYFAMALIFASRRWGDGEGIFNYSKHACDILHEMRRVEGDGKGRGMFDPDNKLIRFIPEVDFSDPSYHLPHYYELFAKYAYEEDRQFYAEAATNSREYLHKACHEVTGLNGEYANYDGSPFMESDGWGRHDWYYSDAYRTVMNMALDHIWFNKDSWQEEVGKKFLNYYCNTLGEENWDDVPMWDGTLTEQKVLHPIAVIASNAAAGILAGDENGLKCIKKFVETPLRLGNRRYYDNLLYFFAFLMLGGRYKIY